MSAICHGFVQNAWRKEICSNCFRLREEHSDLHLYSGQYQQQNGDKNSSLMTSNNNHNNHSISILVKDSSMSNNSKSSMSMGRYQSPTTGIPRVSSLNKYQTSSRSSTQQNNNNNNNNTTSFNSDNFKGGKTNGNVNGDSTLNSVAEVIRVGGSMSLSNGNSASKKLVTHPLKGDKDKEAHHNNNTTSSSNNNRNVNNVLNGTLSSPSSTVVNSVNMNGASVTKHSSTSSTCHYNNNHQSNANNSSHSVTNENITNSKRSSSSNNSNGISNTNGNPVLSLVTHTKSHSQPRNHSQKSWNGSQSKAPTGNSVTLTKGDSSNSMENNIKTSNRTLSSTKDLPDSGSVGGSVGGDTSKKGPLSNGHATKKRYKGILKAMDGKKPKLSVKFPPEVCKVIGYGGIAEDSADEDEEEVSDPQDLVSVAELMVINSTTNEEKELNRQTVKNTNFNSIKTNLLGYAPIEIGPIVGCTGGKSMEGASKPLVSIGTFEGRKEPLKIRKSEDFVVEVKNDKRGDDKEVVLAKASKMTSNNNKHSSSNVTKPTSNNNNNNSITAPAVESKVNKSQLHGVNASSDNVVVNVNTTTTLNSTGQRQCQSSSDGNDVKVNGKDVNENNGISTIQVNPEKSPIKIVPSNPILTTTAPTVTTASSVQAEKVKRKPILKNNQVENNEHGNGTTTTTTNTNSGHKNNTNNKNSDKSENSLSNLFILNGGNIASKRTSFLQEIISASEPVTVLTATQTNNNKMTLVDEMTSLNLDGDSLETTQVPVPKADIKINSKLNNLKSYEFQNNDSEFDDSLEDSGLDIGRHDKSTTRVENSESDDNDTEKFGSSSDSGNENDYHDRIVVPKGGLYISVDDVDSKSSRQDSTKPKLSPDSVLFSSASSGSSESIPECVNRHVISSSPVKRPAPPAPMQPPPSSVATTPIITSDYHGSGGMSSETDQIEDVYDDVGTYQQTRRMQVDEHEEESIYDDCLAVSAAANANGKSVTGSYDFTNGTRTILDTDGIDMADKIPLRPNDGIEFIGIRKIDSETHLNASIPSIPRSPSPENPKRSSSVSPKARRKVNQFFSTIGKKAGAAFSSHNPLNGHSGGGFIRNKSPSPITSSVTGYKRSLSQDEVSMTRTQEIYATLTPTSLKFKGLAPVLQKLSRMDLDSTGKEENPKEKMFKKHKILPSIRNFLRMGSGSGKNVETGPSGTGDRSYDFKTELKHSGSDSSSSSNCASSESSSNPPSLPSSVEDTSSSDKGRNCGANFNVTTNVVVSPVVVKPVIAARPNPAVLGRPPPPPPRIHSLDLLNKASGLSNSGTKPARPPPPRSNKIAPSFVSVFAAAAAQEEEILPGPPNKPKRKASMNCHPSGNYSAGSHNSARNSLDGGDQSLDNNVISLNFETLKLIASQVSKKIKRKSSYLVKFSASPIRWSQFYVSSVEPMAQGDRFAFYSALWEDEPCVLLLQESSDEFPLLQFTCVDISAKFDDFVPIALVPWSCSEYAEDCTDIKVNISVLPSCTVKRISNYISSLTNSRNAAMQKYFSLLQTLEYWGKEEMNDLLVFQGGSQDEEAPEDSELVYVVPITHKPSKRPPSFSQLSSNFEISIKQLLLQPNILSGDDRQALFRLISGTPEEVQAQIKLFLQAKLLGHKIKPEDLEKLKKNKSERIFLQWMEKERALAMHDAIERTLKNEPITPLKKFFVELLLIPTTSAKIMLEMLLDLIN